MFLPQYFVTARISRQIIIFDLKIFAQFIKINLLSVLVF
ncbi:hypothetical protein DDD_2943 [Nonlabens dokdonensis DSW-6]|uniref:Uncharacterized protein n=1 Tax=Nonlabens dokdonensis (strain DSM 17205 / KCTC 12402 / DSW-6) TaxID=592029 RepID=L7W8N9_NONDD|nr:hypothetical protein DDD_2943 [Nonlabens dokdonensis DSW-6]